MAELTFEGGINEQDETHVQFSECTVGYNFELGVIDTHFRPRKAFDRDGTSVPNGGAIRGIMQLIKTDDTETTLVQADGDVYKFDGSTYSSVGTCVSTSLLRGQTWQLGDYMVITDLNKDTVVKKWDGTDYTDLPTGLTSVSLFAKYAVVHLGRMWLFNVTAGTDTPHMMVASEYENPESYDTTLRATDTSFSTGNEAFFMLTPNLRPINGVALFYDTLVISTEGGVLYKLTGTDSTNFVLAPFYVGSAAIGTETVANIGNDIVFMRRGGIIESLRSTDRFGDVSTDDLSRWVRTSLRNSTDAITVYDQTRQKVFFFLGTNKVYVLFKDMIETGLSPWSKYSTQHASGFDVNAAAYIRDPGGTAYHVYFGGSDGYVYHMDGDSNGDAGTADIETFRRSRLIDTLQTDTALTGIRGRVHYKRVSDLDLLMYFEWTDDYSRTLCTVPLEGPPITEDAAFWGGSSYWGSTAWNIENASSASESYDVTSEESNPTGLAFKSDGTKMYVIGAGSAVVNQYALSTAWDVTTASFETSFSVSSQDAAPLGFEFKTDGTKMFVVGTVNKRIYEYALSTAWDISSASFTTSVSHSSEESATARGLAFKSGGTKMFLVGDSSDRIYQYSLSVAWDVSTATYSGTSFDPTAQSTDIRDIAFDTDGAIMFIQSSNKTYQYALGTAWDISTATFDKESEDLSSLDLDMRTFAFRPNGHSVFFLGSTDDIVYHYTIVANDQAYYWNSGFFYAQRISTKGFSPVGIGPGFYLELSITGKDTFDILKITDKV